MKEFFIRDASVLRQVMVAVWLLVSEKIHGGPLIVTVARESKTRSMERKYHAMINDIARQVTVFGRQYAPEVWKALLVDQYEQEVKAAGGRLGSPSETIVSMDGQRRVTVRPSTTRFKKHEGAEFIEFLYAQGCEMGVGWSEPALAAYQEYATRAAA